jgi:CheY-like chemotaxis protein
MEILVAEDDPDIVFMYRKLLENRGHIITVTNDGEQYLDVYHHKSTKMKALRNQNGEGQVSPFDAVILDHKMPKMDGLQVAREIVSIHPLQKIIIVSAFAEDVFGEAAV